MKKTIKLVSFLCILTLLINCVCSFNVSAITKDGNSSVSFSESDNRVNALLHSKNIKLNINSRIALYDTNENIIALAYKLSPTGYVIMDNDSNIIEYSFTLNLPFSTDKKIYYTGPLNYYSKNGSFYIHEKSQEKLTNTDMQLKSQNFAQKSKNASLNTDNASKDISSTLKTNSSNAHYTTSYEPRTIDYNPNGICGSTAAAILLFYYRDHVDSFMVPSWHDTSSGESLIKLLEPNIDGSSPGSVDEDVANGLNWYFRWRGISSGYSATHCALSWSKYQSLVTRNRPVIVGVTGHPTYHEHWVVGYGYSIDTSGGNPCYLIVNDGWGDNGISMSINYTDYMVYLNK